MTLSTSRQYKLDKSQPFGYLTEGLNLAPADTAAQAGYKIPTLCPMAGACARACLQFSGMNQMTTHADVRLRRTVQLFEHRADTIQQLGEEIRRGQQRAERHGLRYAYRPNLLSDLPWLGLTLADQLPDVQFYDYTKIPRPWERQRHNYHLTFSYSERATWADALECFEHGVNVAIVFSTLRGNRLPSRYRGLQVIDGDQHDLRFLDKRPRIVGLRFKGSQDKLAAAVRKGFVLRPYTKN